MKLSANQTRTETKSSGWSLRSWFTGKPQPEAQPVAAPEPEAPIVPPGAKRILVVDDDEVMRMTTAMKLKAHGYAVTTAADGPTAIHAARSQHPDVILLDLEFPPDVSLTWDGFGIMQWLRRLEVTKNIPIIIVTGRRGNELNKRAAHAGAAGVFNKPVDYTPLFGLIEARLSKAAKA